MNYDAPSAKLLKDVCPKLQRAVYAAMDAGQKEGLGFRVAQGLRTWPEQDALYAQGRSLPGKIVTNARGGQSNHNFGLAVDCVPFTQGFAGSVLWDANTPRFRQMVFLLKAQGLAWGGAWDKPDCPHFYLGPKSPTQADRDLFAKGGLSAVWRFYGVD